LEAAVQEKAVTNAEELSRYIRDVMVNSVGRREAVAVGLAYEAVTSDDLIVALAADTELEAMKLECESRMASRQMGRQVIRLAVEQAHCHPMLADYQAAAEAGRTPAHLPVCLGLVLAAAGWTKEAAIAAYLYQTAVGFVSAAMKLLPIGQREGQRLLAEWLPVIERVSAGAMSEKQITSWSPVQDIYAMRHSRLESRLFRS
jgi:urease accessory protein